MDRKQAQRLRHGLQRIDVSDPIVRTIVSIALEDFIERYISGRRHKHGLEQDRRRWHRYKVARRLLMAIRGQEWGGRAKYNPAKRKRERSS